jgi:hypothetical protein
LTYQGEQLHQGYIISSAGIVLGLTSRNTGGFSFTALQRNQSGSDWIQPIGSLELPGDFLIDLPVLIDTGIDEMLLWLNIDERPPALASYSQFPSGIKVTIAIPSSVAWVPTGIAIFICHRRYGRAHGAIDGRMA